MIRREVFKQFTKFTYSLETDKEKVIWWSEQGCSNIWPRSRTLWRRMERKDGQMGDIQNIDQVHLLSGDGWRGRDKLIMWEVFKLLTKFTYELETDEEERIEWSEERISKNWPSSRTSWRWMKRMHRMIKRYVFNNWLSSPTSCKRMKRKG